MSTTEKEINAARKWFTFSNAIFAAFLLFVLWQKVPTFISHWQLEGKPSPIFALHDLEGNEINLAKVNHKLLLVFWATWCGPCKVELSRVQHLIDTGKLKKENVIAISSNEDRKLVAEAVKSRSYTFPVALDPNSRIANQFQVTGTPTTILRDEEGKIAWITTGLSPSLEARILYFF